MKMKTPVSILLILTLLMAISCNQENKYQDAISIDRTDFKTTQSLTGLVVEFDSMILKPRQLQLYDSLLITYNSGADKLFHIFNLKTKKKIGECISMGQGPTEMLQPFFVPSKDSVVIFDMATSILSKYSIAEFISNQEPIASERIKLTEQLFSGVSFLGKDMIGSMYRPEYPLYIFNSNGETIKEFGAYPVSDITYTDIEIIDAYRSVITTNLTDRVAVCHYFTDLIDIYNKEGALEKRIHGPEHIFPHFKEYVDGNIVSSKAVKGTYRDAFYSPVSVGEDFFVLYNGKSVEEKGYNLLAKEIFVFGWDGKPKQRILLDKGVFRIAVDQSNKKIYGISDDPEYHIVEFSYK